MVKLKHTKKFLFDYAQYTVSDNGREEYLLKIYYKKNRYELVKNGRVVGKKFEDEIRKFAKDLLSRKHGINFAKNNK